MKRLIALVLSIAMLLTMTATFACAESSVAVKKVILSQATETLLIGGDSSLGQAVLTARVEPENADCQTVQWSSSNEKVATVDAEGHIQGLSVGLATITAVSTENPKRKASCKVKVVQAVTAIELDAQTLSINKGTKATIHATILPAKASNKKYSWASSDETVATVNAKGQISALENGECTISCTAADDGGKTATCALSVVQPVESLLISEDKLQLIKGATKNITALCMPANAAIQALEWSSSNKKVATIDENGKVTAVSPGQCTITCAATDGSKVKEKIALTVEYKYAAKLKTVKVGYDSIGTPEVYVSVKNVSRSKDIIAFTFATRCYNAYGNELQAHGFGDTVKGWLWQEGKLRPNQATKTSACYWPLYGFDAAYSVDVWLTSYRTSDGTIVDIPDKDIEVITWTR